MFLNIKFLDKFCWFVSQTFHLSRYQIVKPSSYGNLLLNEKRLFFNDSFTQDDISKSKLVYQHDDSEIDKVCLIKFSFIKFNFIIFISFDFLLIILLIQLFNFLFMSSVFTKYFYFNKDDFAVDVYLVDEEQKFVTNDSVLISINQLNDNKPVLIKKASLLQVTFIKLFQI